MDEASDNPEAELGRAYANAVRNFQRLGSEVPSEIQKRESELATSLAATSGSPIKKLRLLHKEIAIISAAIGPFVACGQGCTSCCHYNVHLYPIEAELIEKRTQHQRLKAPEPGGNFHGTPCPFLTQGKCGIYSDRPMSCRRHFSLTDTSYWCHPDRSNLHELPMPQFDQVERAFKDIVAKDGRGIPLDIRQVFGSASRYPGT